MEPFGKFYHSKSIGMNERAITKTLLKNLPLTEEIVTPKQLSDELEILSTELSNDISKPIYSLIESLSGAFSKYVPLSGRVTIAGDLSTTHELYHVHNMTARPYIYDVVSSLTSSCTNSQVVGAKCLYDTVSEISGEIDELNEKQNQTVASLHSLSGSVTTKFGDIDRQLTQIDSRFETVDSQILQTNDRITLLSNNLTEDIEAVSGKVDLIDGRVVELSNAVNALSDVNQKIETISGTVDSIDSRLDIVERDVSNARNDISSLSTTVSDVRNIANAADAKADEANNAIAALAMVAKTGSYNDLEDKPEFPADAVSSVNGKVGAVVLNAHDVSALSLKEAEAGYTEWTTDPEMYNDNPIKIVWDIVGWKPVANRETIGDTKGDFDDEEVRWTNDSNIPILATRTRLRPTPEMEEAWNKKQNALTFDNTPTLNSSNPVISHGIATALSGKVDANANGQVADGLVVSSSIANEAVTIDKLVKSYWHFQPDTLTESQKQAFYNENPAAAVNDYAVTFRKLDDENIFQVFVGEYCACDLIIITEEEKAIYDMGSNEAALVWGPNGNVVGVKRKVIVNHTSDIINNGEDGNHPFITMSELENAIATRPTKVEIERGWWSRWTVTCNGVDVTSQVPQPLWTDSDLSYWYVPDSYPSDYLNYMMYDKDTGYDGNSLLLEWNSEQGDWTATRHRVAAPVPTKPEDIGAQPAGDYALEDKIVFEPGNGSFSAKQKQSGEDVNSADGEAAFAGGAGSKALGKTAFAFGDHVMAIGDSAYATGKNTFAGVYGWYYKYVNLTTGTFYLTTEQPDVRKISDMGPEPEVDTSFESGFAVGDVISYVNKNKRDLFATVVSVEGNKIVVGQLNDTEYVLAEEHPNRDDWSIFVPEKPTIGDIWLGEASFAEGLDTKAINAYSHTEGRETLAYGQYGHAEGKCTKAGYASHAEGADTKADGQYSHAEGRGTTASGLNSHVEGLNTVASASNSHAEGGGTRATFDQAHSEGYHTVATANSSHAEGYNSLVIGIRSHIEGSGIHYFEDSVPTTAAEAETLWDAEDSKTTGGDLMHINAGKYAHVEGLNNFNSADCSHVEGQRNKATGTSSHAEGWRTRALKPRAHSEGESTIAGGQDSHAEGYQTKTQNRNEHAEGSFNKSNKASDSYGNSGNTLHSIGYGTSESTRKNAVEVMQDGKVFITGIGGYNGTNSTVSGIQDITSVINVLSAFQTQVVDRLNDLQRQIWELSAYHTGQMALAANPRNSYVVSDKNSTSFTLGSQTGPATIGLSAYDLVDETNSNNN